MPNEKKSACSAIRSATKQARGSSIIVPISRSTSPAALLLDDALDQLAHQLELLLVGDERDHDLDLGRRPARRDAPPRTIARTCIS